MLNQPETTRGTTRWQWIFSLIVSLNYLMYGMEAGWISPMTHDLQSKNSPLGAPVSNAAISFLASIVSFVAAFMVPVYSHMADYYGRKWVIFATPFPQIISILLRIAFPNLIVLAIARALAGLSASGTFIVITIYLREISQHNLIATLGSLPTLLQNTGFLTMFIIGAACENYFTILWIFFVLPCLSAVLFITIPESPDYLVKQGKIDHAHETIAFLRGLKKDDPIVTSEVEFMKRIEDEHKLLPKISFKVILSDKAWRRGFLIILVVFTIHAWNGAFTILVFAEAILDTSAHGHYNIIRPDLQTISFPTVMIIASLCFIFIAEKWGRRHLLATAFSITTVAFIILGVGMKLDLAGYHIPSYLPLLSMIVVVIMYSGGVRPLPSIIATEMFSFQIRAKVMGCLIGYSWVVVSTQLFAYGPLVDTIGLPSTFIMFGIVNIIGLISALLLPETKGRNVEEIKKLLLNARSS